MEAYCPPIGLNELYIAGHRYLEEPKGEKESQRNQEKKRACQSEILVRAIPVG